MKWKSSESGLNTGFLKGYEEMKKVMFVCWGNICRSPMAEFVLKDMVKKRHLEERFEIASCAISSEEIWNGRGNPVYPPARKMLAAHGIDCTGKRAVQIKKEDYRHYDYIIAMEQHHIRHMERVFGGDPEGKLSLLMDYTNRPGPVADPWYTDDFETAYTDIEEGCAGFLEKILCEIRG